MIKLDIPEIEFLALAKLNHVLQWFKLVKTKINANQVISI